MFYSRIVADYIMKTNSVSDNIPLYYFIKMQADNKFYGVSFFPDSQHDYTFGQVKYSLLYKEKIHLLSGETWIQFNKIYDIKTVSVEEYSFLKKSGLKIYKHNQDGNTIDIRYHFKDRECINSLLERNY